MREVVGTRAESRHGGGDPDAVHVPLLEGRLTQPPIRPGLVPRTAILEHARSPATVALVTGGPGYGKTSLLAQLADLDARPTAWLSLDASDDDPVVLLTYLAAALSAAVPIDTRVVELLGARASSTVPGDALRLVLSAISNAPSPFLFVIDDIHVLTNPAAIDVLAAVVAETPEGSRITLAGRWVPSLPVARLRTLGRLCEIGPSDLAMDPPEAAALLREAGVSLETSAVDELTQRTEGWPAGLYLAALAISAGGDRSRVVEMSGRDRFVADYLRVELLGHLEPEAIDFLTSTSILDRLSGPLCDALLERSDSATRLRALADTNRFVIPLDQRGTWYRCHQLFRDVLLADLDTVEHAHLLDLHRRASAWLEANGAIDEAIEHAHAAGEVERAARLVGAYAQPAIARGRQASVLRWLRAFDDDALTRWPTLALLGAWVHILAGDPVEAVRLADLADDGDDRAEALDGSASFASSRAMLRAMMCRHGPATMRHDAALAYDAEPISSLYRPLAVTLLGAATLIDGDPDGAESLFAEAAAVLGPSGGNPSVVVAWAERAALALDRGDPVGASVAVRTSKEIATAQHLEGSAMTALTFAVAARCLLHAGDHAAARRELAAAHVLRPYVTHATPWLAVQLRLQMGHALLALADTAGARTMLVEAEAILRARPDLGALVDHTQVLRERASGQPVGGDAASTLTTAELRLLPLLPTHLSFPEIGERLFISRSTVKTQAISVYRKLGVSSRGAAVDRAREIGLLPP